MWFHPKIGQDWNKTGVLSLERFKYMMKFGISCLLLFL